MSLHLYQQKQNIKSVFYAAMALLVVSAMLIWPRETYEGAVFGLEIWSNVLVPSLLPFFIIVDLILNLGIVNMLGILLEPIMRPLFNLPGAASFAIAMGFTSGFPMGAVVTRRIYEEHLCQAAEAERLVAFTNNSSPLFIIVAIAVGFFSNQDLGLVLLGAHYLSNILLGIMLGFFAPRSKKYKIIKDKNLLAASFRKLLEAQKNRKPLGKMFADAIYNGIKTIILIGGFVIIYAVLIKLLNTSGLLDNISRLFASLLKLGNFNPNIAQAFSIGFLEITLGLKTLSQYQLSFVEQAVAASIILGWSGLCIQSQVISVLAGSEIRSRNYIWCRGAQSLLSGFLAYILAHTNGLWGQYFILPVAISTSPSLKLLPDFSFTIRYTFLTVRLVLVIIVILITMSLLIKFYRFISTKHKRFS